MPAQQSVSTMVLMPIAKVADSYPELEGHRVEATGVLVGLLSGGQVHVIYVVRELAPLASLE